MAVNVSPSDPHDKLLRSDSAPRQGFFLLPYFEIRGSAQNASDNFEEFCCELAIVVESLPKWTHPYGRRGQRQDGIDIRGETTTGSPLALQCKLEKPPRSAKGKVAKLKKWVADYDRGHERHGADRLIICAPWPADAEVVDYLARVSALRRTHPAQQRFDVEVWNQQVLDKFASAHPEIVRRYFGSGFAYDIEKQNANIRAAAVRVGVDEYFELGKLRASATDLSREPLDRASDWDDLAKRYRSVGFPGKANDAELRQVEMLKAVDEETALSVALGLASRALDDLQVTRSQLILSPFQGDITPVLNARRDALHLLRMVVDGDKNTQTLIRLSSSISEIAAQDRADTRLVPIFLMFGEVSLCRRWSDGVAIAARALSPLLNHLRGSTEFARAASLLAETGERSWDPNYVDATTDVGRILLWSRRGRHHFSMGQAPEAVAAYEQAELAAVQVGLEGPARHARECIASIRQWMPMTTSVGELFSEISADIELHTSYDDRFGDFPNSADRAGDVGLAALTSTGVLAERAVWRDASAALLTSVRSGFVVEEFRCHKLLAHLAARSGDWESGSGHAVLAGDTDLAATFAVKANSFVDLTTSLTAMHHNEAKAAAAAIAGFGWYAPIEEVGQTRTQLMLNTKRAWGMRPLLPELSLKAIATMSSFPMTAVEWSSHLDLLAEYAPVVSAGGPLEDVCSLARWLYRWSEDEKDYTLVDELILESCAGESGILAVGDRRRAYIDVLVERCERFPDTSEIIGQRWRTITGEDMWGDEGALPQQMSDVDVGGELTRLLALRPNEDPHRRSGYVVPGFSLVNAARWTPEQRVAVVETLLVLAHSPLDTWTTRRSALQRVADVGAYAPPDERTRSLLTARLLRMSGLLRDAAPPVSSLGAFDYDRHLWARALLAAAALMTKECGHLLVGPLSELLFSEDLALVNIGAEAIRYLAHNEIVVFPSEQLLAHANMGVRRAGIALAIANVPLKTGEIQRIVSDPDPQVRMSLANQLDRLRLRSPELAEEVEDALTRDRHSLVRWAVLDNRRP